jgi:hypothetical protein
MEYTNYLLALLGFLGILCHNLVKMNSINRQMNGNINLYNYWKLERFSIALSCVVVIGAVMASNEIKQLHQAGKYIGIGFFAIGYMAQSIIVTFGNKTQKMLDDN